MPRKPSQPGEQPGASVTLVDVARVAGVAPMTVSRALNRPELVRKETVEKVRRAVRSTGYVPNLLAGGLASKKSRLVALFLPTIANSIFADTVQAIMDRLTAAGYQTLLGLTGYSAEREEELVEAIIGRRPDGIVLIGTLHTAATRTRLARANIPVVEAWDLSDDPLDMQVGFSHEAVGRSVAGHLLDKGYRDFGVVTMSDPRGLRRSRALVEELARRGVAAVPVATLTPPATLERGREGTRELLDGPQPPRVIVCSSDTLAQGVLAEAAKRGLRVPDDLAVMGFGNLSTAAHVHPALSTVDVAGARLGQQVAKALLERFDAPPQSLPHLRIDTGFSVIQRETT